MVTGIFIYLATNNLHVIFAHIFLQKIVANICCKIHVFLIQITKNQKMKKNSRLTNQALEVLKTQISETSEGCAFFFAPKKFFPAIRREKRRSIPHPKGDSRELCSHLLIGITFCFVIGLRLVLYFNELKINKIKITRWYFL